MKTFAILVALCAVLTSCWKPHPPEPTPEPGPQGGGSPASCADVCARAGELSCSWARPTKEGSSCADVCDNVQQSGILRWNLACRKKAASCEAMDACE